MSLGVNFLPGFFAGGEPEGGVISQERELLNIGGLHIFDNTNTEPPLDFSFMTRYGMDVIQVSQSELESTTAWIKKCLSGDVLVEITKYGNSYNILVSRPESDSIVTTEDCNVIIGKLYDYLWETHFLSIGVPTESLGEVSVHISAQMTIAGESPRNEMAVMLANSIIPMVSSMILFLFIFTYGSLTAQAIATEKTSRVMETLLTSIRPMAVILGKVLGMGLASFSQFFALVAVGFGVSAVVAPFGALGQIFGSVEIEVDDIQMQMFRSAFDDAFAGFNIMSIVWIVVIFLLGFMFYSLIAGLFGATVSRIEDLQSALTPMSLIGVLGFYLAYVAPAFSIDSEEVNIVQKFSYYFPISSPFALPGVIISGEMNTIGALISVGFLALCCVLMLMFVSRVYETIITHTGNRITLGAMFKMAKNK
jgi:ABC-2 type transport system permease protein